MRVLHLTTDSQFGGAERLLVQLSQSRELVDYEPIFCTLRPRGPFHEAVEATGATALTLGVNGGLGLAAAAPKLLRLLRRYEADLLHTHLYHAGVLGWAASRVGRIPPRVHTRHYEQYFHIFGHWWDVLLDRRSTNSADHVVAISEGVRRVLVEREGTPDDKVTVIHNGIATRPSLRNPSRAPSYDLVCVGNLSERKGHRYLIEAMAEIRYRLPAARLVILGEGPERTALAGRVKALGLEGVVELPGFVDGVEKALAGADLMVHPSLEEGLGISLLEGMAQECPIVATRVGGIPEVVDDGFNGLLVPPADPAALAGAVVSLLEDRDRLRAMGASGRRRFECDFSHETMLSAHCRLYARVLCGRRGDARFEPDMSGLSGSPR